MNGARGSAAAAPAPVRVAVPWKDAVRAILRRRGYDLVHHPLRAMLARRGIETVIDVGAHEGGYGRDLRAMGYRGRIVSFEPLAASHAALARAAAADPLWTTHAVALGAAAGTGTLHVGIETATSSLLPVLGATVAIEPEAAVTHREGVAVQTLDDLFGAVVARASGPVLFKIDTQGSEGAVLDGAAATLARTDATYTGAPRIDALQVEVSFAPLYAGQPLAGEIIERLRGAGFGLVGLEHGFIDPATHRLLQADAFFERVAA